MCLRNFNWINPSDYLCIMRTSDGVCATILTVEIIPHNNSHVVSQWFGLKCQRKFQEYQRMFWKCTYGYALKSF